MSLPTQCVIALALFVAGYLAGMDRQRDADLAGQVVAQSKVIEQHDTREAAGHESQIKAADRAEKTAKIFQTLQTELTRYALSRGQKTEDRGQRTEDRGQRTEDRGQRTDGESGNRRRITGGKAAAN
jgi:hypothetical protein